MRHTAGALVVGSLLLLMAAAAHAQCPSDHISDVLKDPRVREALDDAWRDSHEGDADEHEEGGWIYQCQMPNVVTGEYRYYTEIRRWPPGDVDSSGPAYPPRYEEHCRLVADFHTHPGPGPGVNPGRDGHPNQEVSGADLLQSANNGIPGIMRYGHGSDPHDTTDVPYGYGDMAEPRDPSWRCPAPPRRPGGFGDPHLTSLDGRYYDFMAIGDFNLMSFARGDVDVQVRLQPYRQRTSATVTTALVVRDGRDRVEWSVGQDDPLVNGVKRHIPVGNTLKLQSYGIVKNTVDGYLVLTSVGDRIEIYQLPESVDYTVQPAAHRRGTARGLLGNFDGDPDNDLRSASGKTIAMVEDQAPEHSQPLYAAFGESWRVVPAKSLFSTAYRPADGIDPAAFPSRSPAADDGERAAAQKQCQATGIADPALLDACVFDAVQTGSDSFTASAVRVDAKLKSAAAALPAGGRAVPNAEWTGLLLTGTRDVSYTIDLERGVYLFDARGSRGTQWSALSSDGTDLLAGESGRVMGDYPIRRVITKPGHYTIQVGLHGDSPSGRFRFRVRSVAPPAVAQLPVGEAVEAHISSPGEARDYTLDLVPGRYDFEPTTTDDLSWSLTNSAGDELFDANQHSFMQSAKGVVIQKPGTYTLETFGRWWVGTGSYSLKVVKTD